MSNPNFVSPPPPPPPKKMPPPVTRTPAVLSPMPPPPPRKNAPNSQPARFSDDVLSPMPPPVKKINSAPPGGNVGTGTAMLPPPARKVGNGNNSSNINNNSMSQSGSNEPPPMPPPSSPAGVAGAPPPPPSAGPTMSGRDAILLKMQQAVVEFYQIYNPDKIDKEVIAVALQLWWDSGLMGLNVKLMDKYGAGINGDDVLINFNRENEDITLMPKDEINEVAAKKHLIVRTLVKQNESEFFKGGAGDTKSIRLPPGGINAYYKNGSFTNASGSNLMGNGSSGTNVNTYGTMNGGQDLFESSEATTSTTNVNKVNKKSKKQKSKKKKQGNGDTNGVQNSPPRQKPMLPTQESTTSAGGMYGQAGDLFAESSDMLNPEAGEANVPDKSEKKKKKKKNKKKPKRRDSSEWSSSEDGNSDGWENGKKQ